MSGNNTFTLPGRNNVMTKLTEPISTVAGKDVLLNSACFLKQDKNEYLKNKPLCVFGVELDGGEINKLSIIAFSLKGATEATTQLAVGCFSNKAELLAVIQKVAKGASK